MKLSRGGADATVVREFDYKQGKFVTPFKEQDFDHNKESDPNSSGFYLPEAKSVVAWKSLDVLLVGTDMHDGESLTDSGYPRVVREWHRGTLNYAVVCCLFYNTIFVMD